MARKQGMGRETKGKYAFAIGGRGRVREKPLKGRGATSLERLSPRSRTQTARDPGTGLTEGLGKPSLSVSAMPFHIWISTGWEVQVPALFAPHCREPGQTGLQRLQTDQITEERENIHFHSPPGTAIIPLERPENLDLSTEQFSL